MEEVSLILKIAFIIITFLTVFQFYLAAKRSKSFLMIALAWMLLQMTLGLAGFYENEFTKPPRFVLMVLPPLLLFVTMFFTTWGKNFISSLDIKKITILHLIRVPVELVLYYLFLSKSIPEIMTFSGYNFDILAGLSAPFIYYFAFRKKQVWRSLLFVWNIICLLLLMNIVGVAVLSAKTPFQQFAFEQPNIAVFYSPFNWLPSVVVPLVLLSHLVALKQLIQARLNEN